MTQSTYLIPTRVRRGALKIVGSWSASPEDIVRGLETRVGFHTIGELIEALDDRFGAGAGAEFHGRLLPGPTASARRDADTSNTGASVRRDIEAAALAEGVLLAVPDHTFNAGLEGAFEIVSARAFELMQGDDASRDVHDSITRLFTENGVPYAFDENDRLAPTGSAAMSAVTVQPALDVLDDPRLADARTHLVESQRRLQEPDPDEAVDEARMAVEYGFLALLDATGSPRPARHQPNELFRALVDTAALSRNSEELLLSAPRFRGRTTAGHAGTAPVASGEARR